MLRAAVFTFVACCALSALSLAEKKPSATVSLPDEFTSPDLTTSSAPPTTTTSSAPPTTTTSTAPPTTTSTAPPTTTTSTAPPTTTTSSAPPTTTTSSAPPTTTTSSAPPTTTTSTAPPTTTTSTAPPTTTSSAPPNTTTTTKAPNTTTTTKAPNTTTTTKAPPPAPTTTKAPPPAPTTTKAPPPAPTPPTNLTVGNYTVMKDKKPCLLAQMAVQIRLETPKANGTFIVQPKLTQGHGFCEDTKANLTLVFKEGFITFLFNKSMADKTVYVNALSFNLSYPIVKGGNSDTYTANNNSMHLFTAKVGHSYSCRSDSLYMGNGLYLDVNQDRMQAFNLTKSNDFGSPDPCPADQPDYRVAIAVGVTLLVLVVIVVVAYLLSRRRRSEGYQSL